MAHIGIQNKNKTKQNKKQKQKQKQKTKTKQNRTKQKKNHMAHIGIQTKPPPPKKKHTHTHTPLLVKRVNWGYLYTPIQTGTFECGYTPAYWGYTKYECDYTPITWGYPNTPSIEDMLLNAFIWHFRSHAGNAQMGDIPSWQCVHVSLGRIRCVSPIYTFYKRTPTHTPTKQNKHKKHTLIVHFQGKNIPVK